MFVSVIKFVCSMDFVYLVQGISSGFVYQVCDSYWSAYYWMMESGCSILDLEIKKFSVYKGSKL